MRARNLLLAALAAIAGCSRARPTPRSHDKTAMPTMRPDTVSTERMPTQRPDTSRLERMPGSPAPRAHP